MHNIKFRYLVNSYCFEIEPPDLNSFYYDKAEAEEILSYHESFINDTSTDIEIRSRALKACRQIIAYCYEYEQ